MPFKSHRDDALQLNTERELSMSSKSPLNPLSSIEAELADRLENDEQFRTRYIRTWAQTEVASEIRTLRKTRRLRQEEVAKLVGTGQSAISRIEKAEYDGWTFKTLIAIAEVLKARLRITFEPIETVASGYRNPAATTTADVKVVTGPATAQAESIESTTLTLTGIGIPVLDTTASVYVTH